MLAIFRARIGCEFFIRRFAVEAVKSGQINDDNLLVARCSRPTLRSTVVPGKLAVLARRPVSALNKVVLPALGLPTSASVKA